MVTTEVLSDSILEISRQAKSSTEIATTAVTESCAALDIVEELSAVVDEISEVVELITAIAG